MIRLLTMLIIAFATGLFLLLTALVVVPTFVDQDDYKNQIQSLVLEQTGHNLLLHGDVGFAVTKFPQITLKLGKSAIKNSPGFSDNPMIAAESIDLGLDLFSLFGDNYKLAHLSATGLEFYLERDSSGRGNWQKGKKSEKSTSPGPDTTAPATGSTELAAQQNKLSFLSGLSFGGLQIKDANVNYTDHGNGTSYTLTDLSIMTSPFEPGEVSDVAIKGNWRGENPDTDGIISLNYRLLFDESRSEIRVGELVFDVHGHQPGYVVKEAEISVKTDMRYELQSGTLYLDTTDIGLKAWTEGLAFRELGMKIKGTAVVAQGFSSVKLPKVALTTLAKSDTLPPAGIELSTQSDIAVNLTTSTIKMSELMVRGPAGMLISGELTGKTLRSQPELSGNLKMDQVDLQTLMIALGQPLSDSGLLNHAALEAKFRVSAEGGELSDFSAQLDDTNIGGMASLSSFAKPVVLFDIKVDDLDLDRYLSAKKGSTVPVKEEAQSADSPQQVDVAEHDSPIIKIIRDLDLDGKMVFGRLKAGKVVLSDLSMETTAKAGLISMTPVTAQLYDGQLLANIAVDLGQEKPHIQIENHIKGVQAGALLKDLSGDEKFTGLANLRAKLSSRGLDKESIKKNLQGTLSIAVENGEIRGLDVVQKIRKIYSVAVNKQNREDAPADNSSDQATPFSELTVSATIHNGVIENRDLKATSPVLQMTGAGEVDLVAEFVDYTLTADVYSALKALDPDKAQRLAGMTVSIPYKGPFATIGKPKIEDIDLLSMFRSAMGTKLLERSVQKLGGKEKVNRALDRFEKKYGDKLPAKKLLKRLFGL
jgi:AsmA protein